VQDSSESAAVEAVNLRFRKIVVERVTVVKFRVDNRGSDGTGRFRIEVRTDERIQIQVYKKFKTTRYLNR